jgi:hypothetical protein
MTGFHSPLILFTALEALRSGQHSLEMVIKDLLQLLKSIPEGEIRDRLFDQISCLDSIADVIRQALDSIKDAKS